MRLLQTRPRECVEEVHEWIKTEREMREKLKKEKEEVGLRALPPVTLLMLTLDYSVKRRRRRKRLRRGNRRRRYVFTVL